MRGTNSTPAARLSASNRAVSEVIGAILMFALLVTLLGILQATAVPEMTKSDEFEHSQRVEGDMIEISGAISRTAATGVSERSPIQLGVRYPQRFIFVSPPPATGRLQTADPVSVSIENATAAGDVGDIWNGSTRNFSNRPLVYEPFYNQYRTAPVSVYRLGIVSNQFEGTTQTVSGTAFVDGRELSLTMVEGEFRAGGSDQIGVTTRPLSAPARTVTVTDDGNPITLEIETGLPESEWESLLADERMANGGHVTGVNCTGGSSGQCGRLMVTLERGVNYDFRLAKVGIGRGARAPGPAYIVGTGGDNVSVQVGTGHRLTATVRDKFDNPVSGVNVTSEIVMGPGTTEPRSNYTDSTGEINVVYRAPANVQKTETVTVELSYGGEDSQITRFTLFVVDQGRQQQGGNPGQNNTQGGNNSGGRGR